MTHSNCATEGTATDPTSTDEAAPWIDRNPGAVRSGAERLEPAPAEPGSLEALASSCPPLVPAAALTRRGFLFAAGVSTAALAGCERRAVEHALPYLIPPAELTPGVSAHYASTCTACPAGCGLLVTVRDGRPIKMEGHHADPRTGGGLCAMGQAEVRALYDGRRLRGPKLDGNDASWGDVDARIAAGLAALGGRKLVVLTPSWPSPAARRAIAALIAKWGGEHVEYDALSRSAALDACARLFGVPELPATDLARAEVVVSLGDDFLGAGDDPVAKAWAWSSRRGERRAKAPFRHVHVEGSLSLTGACADERWMVRAAGQRLVALWLLRLVAANDSRDAASAVAKALAGLPPPTVSMAKLEQLASVLWAARGKSLVTSGADDPLEQLAAMLTNRFLDNEGATVVPARTAHLRRGLDKPLRMLLDAIDAGQIGGVIVIDADPVDDLPDGDRLASALARLPLSVAVTDRPTATAKACTVVASAHHALERWGDVVAEGDAATIVQPTVRPLFKTRDPIESVLVWAGAERPDCRAFVREGWRDHVFAPGGIEAVEGAADGEPAGGVALAVREPEHLEALWTDAVRNGRAPQGFRYQGGSRTGVDTGLEALTDLLTKAGDLADRPGLQVELIAEPGLRDGQRSFVPWLRELPDPLTRSSWEACVRVAPAKASELGVDDGDVVTITTGQATVELPVRVLPGQTPDVLGVPVGYGRFDGDHGGDKRNGYRLASWDGAARRRSGIPAKLAKTGRTTPLALMQIALTAEGRPIVHQVGSPSQAARHHHEHASMWPRRTAVGKKWEMVVDLDRCTGCSACVVACQAENNIPVVGPDEMRRNRDMYWLRIDRYFAGSADDPHVLFEPMMCSQCENAPCENVCPVAATVHSHDGLNQQVYNRCVGTRYCANNCPYKVRRFNWFDHPIAEPVERLALNPDVVWRDRGVMEKCTFCAQRIQAARIEARKQGAPMLDPEPACAQTCPTRAIGFGDAHAPESGLAAQRDLPRAFQVLDELGVRPSVTYLARVRPGIRAGAADHGSPRGAEHT